MELLDELLRLAEEFDKQRVEYALCGGLARGLYGDVQLPITSEIELLVLEPTSIAS